MLTVEDGSGLSTADSYASVETADAYVSSWYTSSSWDLLTVAEKEVALRKGTRGLDMKFFDQWLGMRATENQALDFPRRGIVFRDNGYRLADNILPQPVVHAAIELSVRYGAGEDPFADVTDPSLIIEESVVIDVIEESVKYASPVLSSRRPVYPILNNLLRRFILPGGTVSRA